VSGTAINSSRENPELTVGKNEVKKRAGATKSQKTQKRGGQDRIFEGRGGIKVSSVKRRQHLQAEGGRDRTSNVEGRKKRPRERGVKEKIGKTRGGVQCVKRKLPRYGKGKGQFKAQEKKGTEMSRRYPRGEVGRRLVKIQVWSIANQGVQCRDAAPRDIQKGEKGGKKNWGTRGNNGNREELEGY